MMVTREPATFLNPIFGSEKTPPKRMKGKVVYIHPQKRFHIVEFDVDGKKIRESFSGA